MRHRKLLPAVLLGWTLLASVASLSAQTVTIPNNHPAFQLPAPTSPVDSTRVLDLTVFLALQNSAQLQTLLTNLQTPGNAQFHQWMTTAQFQSAYYPTQTQISSATTWLSGQGFTVTPPIANSLAISFTGTAAQVEAAFGVSLIKSTVAAVGQNSNGEDFYENTADPVVPAQLGGLIKFIEGLDNLGTANNLVGDAVWPGNSAAVPVAQATPVAGAQVYVQNGIQMVSATPSPTPTCGGSAPTPVPSPGVYRFKPSDLYTYYNANGILSTNQGTGAPDCIAIIASVDFGNDAFTSFANAYGLPAALPTRVPVQNSQVSQGCGAGEVSLDIEWSHTVAPTTPQRVYEFGGNVDLVEAFLAPVNDNMCGAISSSIGPGCNQQDGGYYQAMDQVFQQSAAQGQTFFEAAGDKGAAAEALQIESNQLVCDIGTSNNASAIGGSPNVVTVGGTQFTPVYDQNGDDTSIQGQGTGAAVESVWGNDGKNGAGGGGVSAIFALPPWQANVQNQLGLTSNMRLLPDLAFGASEIAPGFYVYVDYGDGTGAHLKETGGTSIATPMLAGLSRLIAQAANTPRLGNINPLLYRAAAGGTSITGIFDITQGSNAYGGASGYNAQTGFDLASGWGAPNIGNFVPYFAQVVTGSTPTPTPTPTPGAVASPVPASSQGVRGQTVAAGTLSVTNTTSSSETISQVSVQVGDPALFSALSMTATLGGKQQSAVTGTLGAVTSFSFSPALTLAAGATVVFNLSATLSSAVASAQPAVHLAGLVIDPASPAGRAGLLVAAALLLPGALLMGLPAMPRRRIAFFALMLMALAATQVACSGSSSSSPTVLGSSTQQVPAGGVAVTNPKGPVTVQGLPASLGMVKLIN